MDLPKIDAANLPAWEEAAYGLLAIHSRLLLMPLHHADFEGTGIAARAMLALGANKTWQHRQSCFILSGHQLWRKRSRH